MSRETRSGVMAPAGTERPRPYRPRLRYELISCGPQGHEPLGTEAARLRSEDRLFAQEADGVRWYRCLRCDSWAALNPPDRPSDRLDAGLAQVIKTIAAAGDQPVVVTVADADSAPRLRAPLTAQREAEWRELLSDCGNYEAQLAAEVAKGELTLAELDEEEQSLDRLRRWHRAIRARDLFAAPAAPAAERRLRECADALESFASLVYQARERS